MFGIFEEQLSFEKKQLQAIFNSTHYKVHVFILSPQPR